MTRGPVSEESERLLTLLRGGRVDRPPYWEPWFQMRRFLTDRYGGEYGRMAEDLGHAAIPGSYYEHPFGRFLRHDAPAESSMWYSGGTLTPGTPARKWGRPNHRAALARAAKARAAGRTWGRAVWHTLPWCFHAVATAMGLEGFAYACYDAPDFVATAMARVEECNRKAILAIPRRDRPDFFLLDGDCAYRTGLMIDAGMLRKFTLEPTRRTLDLLAELEIPCAFHSDGRLRDLLPYLIELGIRAVHGCESMANDLGELVSEFGDSIVLCGNMDVVFLKNSTPEQVRRSALAMLKTGSAKGRYIAGCNTSPLDYIPAENYVALTRTVQEFARRWASTARRLPRASPMQVSQAP